MATEKANVVVTLNGKAAENALDNLTAKANEYKQAIREANAAGNTKAANKLEKDLKRHNSQIQNLTKSTKNYQDVLNNLNGATIRQLNSAARTLTNEIKNKLTPGTQEFINKSAQLRLVRNRIDQVNASLRVQKSLWSRMGDGFNKYSAMAVSFLAGITGLSMGLRKAAEDAAEMDDTYSDVMKTTQLTRDEVVELNKEFQKIDTRTSREALNNLARDAGKLGITGKEDVLEFVRAADQINVALGEDLGEGAIKNIGKMADVFGLTKKMGIEKSFLSIGSAINALGQDSTAAEAYLVDFTQRLAGVGAQTGISIENILGFASGIDQSAQRVEMAATAFQTFLMNMYSDTATFAKYAGMEVSAFTKLLETDANSAIIKVLTSLKDKEGFAALVPIFKDMGADGARAVSVLSAMATNLDAITTAQALSNEEFAKATSLSLEFAVKNNNMMAKLEKQRKKFKDVMIEFGETLNPLMLQTTKLGTIGLKFLAEYGKELLIVGGTIAGIIVLVKLKALAQLGLNTAMASGTVIAKAASSAYYLLTGRVDRARVSIRAMNKAFSASAIGLIITAFVTLGTVIYRMTERTRMLTSAMQDFYVESGKLKLEAKSLFDIIEKNAVGSELYNKALTKLQETYGPYINHLISEKGALEDIDVARKIVNSEIERSIGLKIKEQLQSEITENSLEKQSKRYEKIVSNITRHTKVGEDAARILASQGVEMLKNGKTLQDVYSTLFSNISSKDWNDHLVIAFGLFNKEYKNFVSDIEASDIKFDFIIAPTDTSDDFIGPMPFDRAKYEESLKEQAILHKENLRKLEELKKKDKEAQQKLTDQEFEGELLKQEGQEKAKQNILKKSYLAKKISRQGYETQAESNSISYLTRKNALYVQNGRDNIEVEAQLFDALISIQNKALEAFQKMEKESAKISKQLKKDFKSIEDEIDLSISAKIKIDDSELVDAFQKVLDKSADLENQAEEIRKEISKKGLREKYNDEMAHLLKLHRAKKLSEDEFDKAMLDLKWKNAEDIAEITQALAQQVANFSDSLQDIEYNKLEVEKNKELALYGNTSDKRAEIESKYEEKKLEVQKKYADIDMGIQISQAIAAGALASIQAWNAAKGNPILAGVFMALIAGTTALQVASIVAQRNAIKSNSVASSSGSSASTRTLTSSSAPSSSSGMASTGSSPSAISPIAMTSSDPIVYATPQTKAAPSPTTKSSSPGVTKSSAATTTPDVNSASNRLLIEAIHLLIERLGVPIEAFFDPQKLKEYYAKLERFKKTASK